MTLVTICDRASARCLWWAGKILNAEGVGHWSIEFTPGLTEGLALQDSQKIIIHWPEDNPDYALMLHEITHAIVGNGHDSHFAHVYMEMVRKYFIPGQPEWI